MRCHIEEPDQAQESANPPDDGSADRAPAPFPGGLGQCRVRPECQARRYSTDWSVEYASPRYGPEEVLVGLLADHQASPRSISRDWDVVVATAWAVQDRDPAQRGRYSSPCQSFELAVRRSQRTRGKQPAP